LNLLNLDDGMSQFVANLISPDFPKNIESIVESMSQYDQSLYGDDCTNIACRRSLVKDELLSSIGISRWSPDGQFLAFAAQIDGPSTDIYIYSMQDKTIRRLTDDLQNVERIDWSPECGSSAVVGRGLRPGDMYMALVCMASVKNKSRWKRDLHPIPNNPSIACSARDAAASSTLSLRSDECVHA
jgi:dipeptidyl aminopeptidase/acylaminoacyl peptidase